MRKGVAIIALILFACATVAHVRNVGFELIRHVDDIIPKIITRWDAAAFEKNALPEIVNPRDKMLNTFSIYRRLGGLTHAESSVLTENKPYMRFLRGRPVWSAKSETVCRFEHGEGIVITEWVRIDGSWKIMNFILRIRTMTDGSLFPKQFEGASHKQNELPFANPLNRPGYH